MLEEKRRQRGGGGGKGVKFDNRNLIGPQTGFSNKFELPINNIPQTTQAKSNY